MDPLHSENTKILIDALLSLQDETECARFLEDLLTLQELTAIGQRIRVADMLSKGYTYETVVKTTGASTATISRVNRCLRYGEGGYAQILAHLNKKEDKGIDGP